MRQVMMINAFEQLYIEQSVNYYMLMNDMANLKQ